MKGSVKAYQTNGHEPQAMGHPRFVVNELAALYKMGVDFS